ncbi:hypothetical protein AABB24_035992 [Solanum stoloniferum]|uniref:F-box domain-containing protein n=1 Tax=Solanum stoloniferum TaxID=62892 RepID=A0ABD2RCA9_9SOLN
MESEPSHQHKRRRKHTSVNPFSSSSFSVQDSNFRSIVLRSEHSKILLRLPVKPLLQFRYVSKSWLISTPICDLWNDPFSTMKRINGMPNQEMWLVEKCNYICL